MVNCDQKKYENNLFQTKKRKKSSYLVGLVYYFINFWPWNALKANRRRKVFFFFFTVPDTKNMECNPGQCELKADGHIIHPVAKEKEINTDGQMSFFRTES